MELAKATRENEWTELGLSPRGTVALTAMAKACAWLNGTGICRSFRCTGIFVCHRASDHSEYRSEGGHIKKKTDRRVLESVPTPTMRQKY